MIISWGFELGEMCRTFQKIVPNEGHFFIVWLCLLHQNIEHPWPLPKQQSSVSQMTRHHQHIFPKHPLGCGQCLLRTSPVRFSWDCMVYEKTETWSMKTRNASPFFVFRRPCGSILFSSFFYSHFMLLLIWTFSSLFY